MGLVLEIQRRACSNEHDVAGLLRLAKVAAVKLRSDAAHSWIDYELNGYAGVSYKDLPRYRKILGSPKALNPYVGWIPIHFQDAETQDSISQAAIYQSLPSLQSDISRVETGFFVYQYSSRKKFIIMQNLDCDFDVAMHISVGQVVNIVESVRNLVLNWALELSASGVSGTELDFLDVEKTEGAKVTNKYIIEHVGVIGNVGGGKIGTNIASSAIEIDIGAARSLTCQIEESLNGLPPDARDEIARVLSFLNNELKRPAPEVSRVSEHLRTIKSIAEGAAGNLTAAGIVQLVAAILGG